MENISQTTRYRHKSFENDQAILKVLQNCEWGGGHLGGHTLSVGGGHVPPPPGLSWLRHWRVPASILEKQFDQRHMFFFWPNRPSCFHYTHSIIIHRYLKLQWCSLSLEQNQFVEFLPHWSGADPGFLKGGGAWKTPHSWTFTSTPPLDIVRATSSALRKFEKHPHSWTFTKGGGVQLWAQC